MFRSRSSSSDKEQRNITAFDRANWSHSLHGSVLTFVGLSFIALAAAGLLRPGLLFAELIVILLCAFYATITHGCVFTVAGRGSSKDCGTLFPCARRECAPGTCCFQCGFGFVSNYFKVFGLFILWTQVIIIAIGILWSLHDQWGEGMKSSHLIGCIVAFSILFVCFWLVMCAMEYCRASYSEAEYSWMEGGAQQEEREPLVGLVGSDAVQREENIPFSDQIVPTMED